MYKEVEITSSYGTDKHIILERENGELTTFPAQEDNPNYQQYLKWLEENS